VWRELVGESSWLLKETRSADLFADGAIFRTSADTDGCKWMPAIGDQPLSRWQWLGICRPSVAPSSIGSQQKTLPQSVPLSKFGIVPTMTRCACRICADPTCLAEFARTGSTDW